MKAILLPELVEWFYSEGQIGWSEDVLNKQQKIFCFAALKETAKKVLQTYWFLFSFFSFTSFIQ